MSDVWCDELPLYLSTTKERVSGSGRLTAPLVSISTLAEAHKRGVITFQHNKAREMTSNNLNVTFSFVTDFYLQFCFSLLYLMNCSWSTMSDPLLKMQSIKCFISVSFNGS